MCSQAHARSPEEFVRGVGTGTLGLLKNAAYGTFNAFGQVRPALLCCTCVHHYGKWALCTHTGSEDTQSLYIMGKFHAYIH